MEDNVAGLLLYRFWESQSTYRQIIVGALPKKAGIGGIETLVVET